MPTDCILALASTAKAALAARASFLVTLFFLGALALGGGVGTGAAVIIAGDLATTSGDIE